MDRKVPFIEQETYHAFTRGVEKRVVFTNEQDYERFMLLLDFANDAKTIRISNYLRSEQGESLLKVNRPERKRERITDILAYSLMPTHFHLILRERQTGGISKFMHKLLTAYSMYFNIKYNRSGPLFTRPFRSRHIDSDEYFRWVFAYVLLNPLELFQADWKDVGLRNADKARECMNSYRYGSFQDYFGEKRPESSILSSAALPVSLDEIKTMDDLLSQLSASDLAIQ